MLLADKLLVTPLRRIFGSHLHTLPSHYCPSAFYPSQPDETSAPPRPR
jgi:hypothetical protein